MNFTSEDLCKLGLGLRAPHYTFLESYISKDIKWLEALTENYLDSFGRPRLVLHKLRENYDIALHGVSLNIASAEGLDLDYLKKLKMLINEIEPFLVSDHLCWTGLKNHKIHDLLPFCYNNASLKVVIENIDLAQSILQRPLILENVSSYMSFKQSDRSEYQFLAEAAKSTGAKILLDINNVYVSAKNLDMNPYKCIDQIPAHLVAQVHLAGFSDMKDYLFDTHSQPVCPEVWHLFSYFIKNNPHTPFMIERDENIPSFLELEKEALMAKKIWEQHHGPRPYERTITQLSKELYL